MIVFSDGSRATNGAVGYGFVIYRDSKRIAQGCGRRRTGSPWNLAWPQIEARPAFWRIFRMNTHPNFLRAPSNVPRLRRSKARSAGIGCTINAACTAGWI
ncbi:hypothetical protein BDP55DRAFT_650615 [Colletotrichum godetiae]|uniref:Uncharacterized protein n=1 Tax=Colletotrichum godetiae TaxID=1209918 RepID=A0AAJ0AV80_9PEZI|nr:uncharacterized protein BDP55DRAFT_650615 [Colletotrichum godetiae]KAK1690413.1 hypothetical protein BDP55DRAFT_650615 [Colletotrichum godetiae]